MFSKYLRLLVVFATLWFPVFAFSESKNKQLCFNSYIITKSSGNHSEQEVYEKQKKILFNQFSRTQLAFEKNKSQNCPIIEVKKGVTKRINWKNALLLSQPLDFDETDNLENYYLYKTQKSLKSLQKITKIIKQQKNLKYYSFLEYQPIRKVVYAELALDKLKTFKNDDRNKSLEKMIASESHLIMQKMEEFEPDSHQLLIKDRKRVKQYEAIDDTSSASWEKGEMILWNDLEAQNTSIEMKNLLNRYRTPENQCLDVYVIPAAKTPSRSIKEAKDYGRLTHRGGAALSSRLFPRTTANKGHAIILTYNSGSSEYRLAHELGHLLIHKNNAHEGKVEKDLMHANSRGGWYLSEAECREISINFKSFHGGTSKNY